MSKIEKFFIGFIIFVLGWLCGVMQEAIAYGVFR
jgi:hypothetical protein